MLGFVSKESSESRVDHSRKERKALAKKDYKKKTNENAIFKSTGSLNFHGLLHESEGKMYCLYCRENEAFADKSSPLFAGCGSEGNYRRDPLVNHNTSKCHLACAKAWQKHNQHEYQPPKKKPDITSEFL